MSLHKKYIKYKHEYLELKNNRNKKKVNIDVYYDYKAETYDYYTKKFININKYINLMKKKNKELKDMEIRIEKMFKFFYVYLIKIKYDKLTSFEQTNKDNITMEDAQVEQIFTIDNNIYINFYLFKDTNKITITLKNINHTNHNKIKDIRIYWNTIKIGDSYVMGYKKPLKHIYQIIQQQYFNRINFVKNISNIMFNEIASNKLDYNQYLLDNNLIPKNTTKIVKKNDIKSAEQFKQILEAGYVVKYPYYSASRCVFLPQIKFKESEFKQCYKDFGYIMQKYNKTLEDVEFKCHVIYGKIYYIMIRHSKNDYICMSNTKRPSDENIIKILDKYEKDIEQLCQKAFFAMNKLYEIKNDRLIFEMSLLYNLVKKLMSPYMDTIFVDKYNKHKFNSKLNNLHKLENIPEEIKNFLLPFKEDEYFASFEAIFTSLFTFKKIERLQELKKHVGHDIVEIINNLIDVYETSDKEFEKKYMKEKEKVATIYEPYMRIDIGLPYQDFDKCYINEIEPYASGKSTNIIKRDKCVDNYDENANSLILQKILKTQVENNDVHFEKIKYNIY